VVRWYPTIDEYMPEFIRTGSPKYHESVRTNTKRFVRTRNGSWFSCVLELCYYLLCVKDSVSNYNKIYG